MVRESTKSAEVSEPRRPSPGRTRASTANVTKSSSSRRAEVGTSQTSTRSKSPSKASPAKTRSPARIRSPARTRSPARKAKTKTTNQNEKPKTKPVPKVTGTDTSKITTRKQIIEKIELDLSGSDEEQVPKEKPKAAVRGRTRNLDTEEKTSTSLKKQETTSIYSEGIRRITRSSQPQEERVVHLKNFDLPRKLGEFSDDDETIKEEPKPKQKTSISGYLSLIFQMIFGPAFLLGLYVFCNKTSCTYTMFPDWKQFATLNVFFDLRSFLGYVLLGILVALLSAFPYGGRKVANLPSKQGKFVYNCNGAFCLFITISAWIAVEYRVFSISKFVVEHILHLASSAIVIALVFSLYLYLRSFYVPITALNASQLDKSGLSGFLYGKEVNPRLLEFLDLKMFIVRFASVCVVLFEISHLLSGLNLTGSLQSNIINMNWKAFIYHPTLLVLVILHITYNINNIIFESRQLSSYFFQYEGLGFNVVLQSVFYPFFWALQTKYVIEHKINLPNWALIALSTLYVFGYVLSVLSNRQKDEFRRNPYSTKSSKMDSLSTSQGKKILCAGCWGWLRQPNILGDILMHVSMLCFSYKVPLVVGFLGLIFALIERAIVSQADCKKKYGSAWEKYCQKVKYVLVPKVY